MHQPTPIAMVSRIPRHTQLACALLMMAVSATATAESSEFAELREMVMKQQQQINALTEELNKTRAMLEANAAEAAASCRST